MQIALSAQRVTRHTSEAVLRDIQEATKRRIAYFANRPDEIPKRLRELDREWDIERCLETGSATLTLSGLLLGITVDRKWLFLSAIVQGFFLQHAVEGWCPPLPVFRRLGVRTAEEIAQERYALKALQGDFDGISSDDPDAAWQATEDAGLRAERR